MAETAAEPDAGQEKPRTGDEMRDRRKRHGWTQRALGAHLGVRREQVARWEGGYNIGANYWPIIEEVLRIRVDPTAPGGWVDADEDDATRAASGTTVVNVIIVVATPAKAREIIRGLAGRADTIELADAEEILGRLGTPTE